MINWFYQGQPALNRKDHTMKHTTTPAFCHQVIRTYNLSSKRDIVRRFSETELAEALLYTSELNIKDAATSMHYHVETVPVRNNNK